MIFKKKYQVVIASQLNMVFKLKKYEFCINIIKTLKNLTYGNFKVRISV